MKIVVMSDAHGNLFFLEKCLQKIKATDGIEKRIYLGDVFGYGSEGSKCLQLLQAEGFECLLGNHDAMLIGMLPLDTLKDEIYRIQRERERISQDLKEFLFSLTPFRIMEVKGKRILFVHGNPMDPLRGYLYEDKLENIKGKQVFDYIFMGHTHRPFIKKHGSTIYVNVGSCGLPRDIGNMPSYAIYDTENEELQMERLEIDKEYIINNYNDVHSDVKKCLLR